MSPSSAAICPRCHQRAPIVLRGLGAQCTACGASRMPFTTAAVNLAGKPSRVGGMAAKLIGSAVLVVGLSMALGAGLLLQTLFPGGHAGLAVGLPVGIISLALGVALLLGGRKLSRHGEEAARAAQQQAIRALAANRGGVVTAADVGRALSLPEAQADALLTELACNPDDRVSLELSDDGTIRYLFGTSSTALRFAELSRAGGACITQPTAPAAEQQAELEQAALEQGQAAQRYRRR